MFYVTQTTSLTDFEVLSCSHLASDWLAGLRVLVSEAASLGAHGEAQQARVVL